MTPDGVSRSQNRGVPRLCGTTLPPAIPVSKGSFFQICAAVQWLREPDRGPFLQAIVDELEGHEIGDGIVARAVGRAFKAFHRPPADETQDCGHLSCCARSAMDAQSDVVLGLRAT